MKKLIFKTALFIVPLFALFALNKCLFSEKKGDLFKLGYIINLNYSNFKKDFIKEYNDKYNFTKFSDINLKKQNKFSVFVIGDSFSEQGSASFHNYLNLNKNQNILHLDRNLHDNPIETLNSFIEGDVLDSIKADYIILESIEREIVKRAVEFNPKVENSIKSLNDKIEIFKSKPSKKSKSNDINDFFARKIIRVPLNYFLYQYDDNAYSERAYQVSTNKKLFSADKYKLLFYDDDVINLKYNNDKNSINLLNNLLNEFAVKLSKKGTKLIVLACPDKLNFYYDDIVGNKRYPKSIFFEYLKNIKKQYIFVDSKSYMRKNSKNVKDIYFYGDTHWTPIAAKIIGNAINEVIISDNVSLK